MQRCYTQNVDGLEERECPNMRSDKESPALVYVNGSNHLLRCPKCCYTCLPHAYDSVFLGGQDVLCPVCMERYNGEYEALHSFRCLPGLSMGQNKPQNPL